MLEEFSYLGSEKAEEVVITNTVKIADMIEKMSPIHPDKYPPVIENSDQDLKDMCFQKAHEMYGEVLPKIVEDRLDKELNSIISNGYAVMYIIAQKLVWKSNADGYLVGLSLIHIWEKVRPVWEDGTSAYTIKRFGVVNRYDLRKEFPALTLRKTALKSAMDEILWIWQKKSNNIHDLHSHIWDSWADENGSIGKAYGYQLRCV